MDGFTLERVRRIDGTGLEMLEEMERANMGSAAVDRYTLRLAVDVGLLWILRQGNEPVGLCLGFAVFERPQQVELFSFHLNAALRGQGLGNWFFGRVLAELDAAGIRQLGLTVRADNPGAVELYRRHGFVVRCEARDHYGPGEDRLVMERRLP